MTQVRIADITDIVMGQSPPGESYNETGEGLPFFQGKAEFGETSPTAKKWCTDPRRIAERGDILMSVRAPVGPTNIASEQCCIGRGLAAIRARASVTQDFLRYFFRHAEPILAQQGQGSTFAAIGRAEIAALTLRLPSLEEQRRLVDLLSRAEGIVRLRREAQRKAAELVPALFLDMFGDPASNPKGWPVVALGDYLSIQSSVRTPDLVVDAHLPCIGADSIESATGRIVSWPTVDEIRPISGKYSFDESDVLYSKIRPALRKAIIAPSNGYCSADMYPLRPNELATAEFVVSLLLSKDFTDYAVGVSMRAQMPKVNRETLFAYKAPLPPIELQRDFAAKVDAVRGIAAQQAAALATAKATFDALLHQSFAVS